MGGFLQALLFGYAGFRLQLENLYFNATLPPGANSLQVIDMDYLGAKLDLEFNRDQIEMKVKDMNPELPLELELLEEERIVVLQKRTVDLLFVNISRKGHSVTHFNVIIV